VYILKIRSVQEKIRFGFYIYFSIVCLFEIHFIVFMVAKDYLAFLFGNPPHRSSHANKPIEWKVWYIYIYIYWVWIENRYKYCWEWIPSWVSLFRIYVGDNSVVRGKTDQIRRSPYIWNSSFIQQLIRHIPRITLEYKDYTDNNCRILFNEGDKSQEMRDCDMIIIFYISIVT
jgi:hypothetical protein